MLYPRNLALAAAATLAVTAAPLNARTLDEGRAPRAAVPAVTVYVHNEFAREVTVQLVTSDGHRLELGPVAANAGHTFQVDQSVLGGSESLRLRVESALQSRSDLSQPLLSDDTVLSREFAITPGAYVELQVGSDLGATRAWIRK